MINKSSQNKIIGLNVLIYLLIFIFPLAFIMQYLDFRITSTPIQLIVYVTIVFSLINVVIGNFIHIKKKYSYLILIYFFLLLLNEIIRGIDNSGELIERIKIHLPLLGLFFFINLLDGQNISEKTVSIAYRAFIIIMIITPLISIYQFFNPEYIISFQEIEYYSYITPDIYNIRRASFFLLESNVALGISFLPIALILSFRYFKNKQNFWFISVLLSAGIVVFLSNTRIMILGYLIIITSFILFNPSKISNKLYSIIKIVLLFVTVLYFINVVGYNLEDFYYLRLQERSFDESHRFDSIITFFRMFPDYFMFGTGSHISNEVNKVSSLGRNFIHIGWLSVIIAFGMIVSLFLFAFYYKFLKSLYHDYRLTGDHTTFISFLLFVVFNFTYVNLDSFSSGLMLALVLNQYNLQKTRNLNSA